MAHRLNLPVAAGVLACLAALVAWIGSSWALEVADGVTQVSDTDYRVQFMDPAPALIGAGLALALLVVAVRLSVPPAAVGLALTVAVLWWAAGVELSRWQASGRGDGLEVLAFALPVLTAVVGALTLLLARLVRPR